MLGEPWQAGTHVGDRSEPWSHLMASDVIYSAGNGSTADTRYTGGLPRYKVAHVSDGSYVDDVWRRNGSPSDYYGMESVGHDHVLGWIQIGPKVRANYAFDDVVQRFQKVIH